MRFPGETCGNGVKDEFRADIKRDHRQNVWKKYRCLHRCTAVHRSIAADQREDGRGFNTCEVVYNYKAQKYEVLNVDTEIGNKEITIL